MSIAIDSMKCRACGKCLDVCPGSLIVRGEDKKAVIRYPKDCWGCASCIKECPFEAISYYRHGKPDDRSYGRRSVTLAN